MLLCDSCPWKRVQGQDWDLGVNTEHTRPKFSAQRRFFYSEGDKGGRMPPLDQTKTAAGVAQEQFLRRNPGKSALYKSWLDMLVAVAK